MTEFYKEDLSGSRFEEIDFTNVRMRNVYFIGALIRGVAVTACVGPGVTV